MQRWRAGADTFALVAEDPKKDGKEGFTAELNKMATIDMSTGRTAAGQSARFFVLRFPPFEEEKSNQTAKHKGGGKKKGKK